MSDKTYVLNPTAHMIPVDIEDAQGNHDTVFLQPGGKPYLPAGFSVTAACLRKNPKLVVKIVALQLPVVTVAPAVADTQ